MFTTLGIRIEFPRLDGNTKVEKTNEKGKGTTFLITKFLITKFLIEIVNKEVCIFRNFVIRNVLLFMKR